MDVGLTTIRRMGMIWKVRVVLKSYDELRTVIQVIAGGLWDN